MIIAYFLNKLTQEPNILYDLAIDQTPNEENDTITLIRLGGVIFNIVPNENDFLERANIIALNNNIPQIDQIIL